ncbi:carboxylate--amine ligase [Berryella wangjianweii]|uniref:Carboxylate--amine ligase n=1 Tax=Berryella wangjianweii TaxID=2734634 RepID=A0A6M8J912_9ACTN|nr:carboxylate--amine ligase [Berryella wangjianweii]QKF07869.1 carboxylate--amine ligase [Berryella wangjianweii]
MSSNADLTNEYLSIAESLGGDLAGRRAARAYMRESTAIVHHVVVDSTFVPRLFNAETYATMKSVSETAHRILCKVIEHYLATPAYRSIFDFDERLRELILLPRDYDAVLPFARVDTFLNEDTQEVRFCEFNGDGSSGMNENREITHSIEGTATFRAFAERHRVQPCELFESWVERFCAIYDTYAHRVENPTFAICDYLDHGVVDEFRIFAELFKARGVSCLVADVRSLTFDGTCLRAQDGTPIHAVWRRCVTNDVLEFWDESQALIQATRARKVALIGSFAGHIVHDKQIFEALHHPATKAILTDDENAFVARTVPLTTFLNDDQVDLADVKARKDAWIIKPTDRYGADNVYAGCFFPQDEWEGLVDRFANEREGFPFIAQHYVTPYRTLTLPPDCGIEELSDREISRRAVSYNNLNGLYLYDGTFQGVFSRLGPLPTISKDMQGITAATIWVDLPQKA